MKIQDLSDVMKNLSKTIEKVFGEVFREVFKFMDSINEKLSELEFRKRIKYKPILKITPNKKYLKDKRTYIFFCRNNC